MGRVRESQRNQSKISGKMTNQSKRSKRNFWRKKLLEGNGGSITLRYIRRRESLPGGFFREAHPNPHYRQRPSSTEDHPNPHYRQRPSSTEAHPNPHYRQSLLLEAHPNPHYRQSLLLEAHPNPHYRQRPSSTEE